MTTASIRVGLPILTSTQRLAWRIAQGVMLAVGLAMVTALFVAPDVGITAVWNVLVPAAPALFVFAPGLWRNVCPLASVALLPRHLGVSRRRRLSASAQGWLAAGGVILLIAIVPLRHFVLDTSGPATGAALVTVGLLALCLGATFEWKSPWCSGLCPVHGVEKLYGSRPAISPPNAHCTECQRCTAVCPDSTTGMSPLVAPSTPGHAVAGALLVGGFPGFVWGWFQVSDHIGRDLPAVGLAYLVPLASMAVTLAVYLLLRQLLPGREAMLARGSAALAVGCYYWYRLPMLVGLGFYPGEGELIDLHRSLPEWTPIALHAASSLLLLWWFLLRDGAKARSWAVRPAFAAESR